MSTKDTTYEGLMKLARHLNKEGRKALAEKWALLSENYARDAKQADSDGNRESSDRMRSFSESYKEASVRMRGLAEDRDG